MAQAKAQRVPVGLLDLPAELRIRISSLVVVNGKVKPIDLNKKTKSEYSFNAYEDVQPSLSLVCHQIRNETLPIYYSKNTFTLVIKQGTKRYSSADCNLRSRPAFERWANAVGDKYARFITDISAKVTFQRDLQLCMSAIHLLQLPPGYRIPRYSALDHPCSARIRDEISALLVTLHDRRGGNKLCVRDIEDFGDALSGWVRTYWALDRSERNR